MGKSSATSSIKKHSSGIRCDPEDWPDFEYITLDLHLVIPLDNGDYAGVTDVLVNTFSRRTISISSLAMLDPPMMSIANLTDPQDQELAIAAIRRTREIFTYPSLTPVIIGAEVIAGIETVTHTA